MCDPKNLSVRERRIRRRAYNYVARFAHPPADSRCELCGEEAELVAHHQDYSKPRELDWICRSCHINWHLLEIRHGRFYLLDELQPIPRVACGSPERGYTACTGAK